MSDHSHGHKRCLKNIVEGKRISNCQLEWTHEGPCKDETNEAAQLPDTRYGAVILLVADVASWALMLACLFYVMKLGGCGPLAVTP